MRKLNSSYVVGLCTLMLVCGSSARVLDNFNDNNKTGWQDFLFPVGVSYASITEANGQFNFSLIPVGQSIFAASTKISDNFELKEGRTIEFRADLVSGNGNDSFAILSFIPTTGGSVSTLSGYGFAKSASDIIVSKGINKYFYSENPATPLKNENVTMVLSLTVKNGNVIINSKLLDKDANNAVIFDQTFTDTPGPDILSDGTDDPAAPYLGNGNFVLMCYEDDGTTQASYDVTFDNAEVFVTDTTVLDDFNDNTKTAWQDFAFPVGVTYASITEANNQFNFSLIPVGQSIFAASTKTSRTFDLVEGERIQFSVDLVTGNGNDSFAILAFIPTSSTVSSLSGYGLSKSASDIIVSKGINKYFYAENPTVPIKNDNVTLALTLTVRNGNVEINAKVLDKDANNAVIFEQNFVDTPGTDILSDGTDDPAAPYLGSGNFVLMCYEDDGTTQASYDVTFDNAVVSAPPAAANTPPIISDIAPAPYSNFLPASSTVSFKVTDDQALDPTGISVVLNGQTLTAVNGLTVSGTGTTRNVSFGGLTANTDYKAVINVTDAGSANSTTTVYFDTFSTNDVVIESEDYNFQKGISLDDPVLYAEGTSGVADSFIGQVGEPDVDYHDTRTDLRDAPYRPEDHVRMQHTLDLPRQKYIDAGGAAALVFDYDVADIATGEWLNYTRNFPAGNYEVYLREALVNGALAKAELQEVTSDPASGNQSTRTVGTFILPTTGYQYRNIPLTDAAGQNKSVLNLSGKKTYRIFQVDGDPADGGIFQNYLVFVPTTASGTQRATISSLSPANGTSIETLTPTISVTIQNRDTSVNTNTIKLYVSGLIVSPQISATTTDANLTYPLSPLPASGSTVTARIEFTDNENVTQTNEWSFTITYKTVDLANRVAGTGATRGMNYHMVQATFDVQPLENSLTRAEAQLAPNSTIPRAIDTNLVVQVVNFSQSEGDAGAIPGDILVPGLDPSTTGDDDFAVEVNAYLELTAGVHRFSMNCDDGYKISVGASLNDRNAPPLAFHNGGPANETFDFLVPQAGLYPVRLVWYERGGGAQAEWASVDLETGAKTLINDPDIQGASLKQSASGSSVVKAYITFTPIAATLIVESSITVSGGYAQDNSAVFDTANKKITLPLPSADRFFRLSGTVTSHITGTQISGNSLILTYE
jgi:hypothetical protein